MNTNRHNPFVAVIALLMLAIIVLFATGCSADTDTHTDTEKAERFKVEYQQRISCNDVVTIFTDTQTGSQYIELDGCYGIGLTCLEQSEPVRYPMNETERRLVEQVVMAESGNECYAGQLAVAQCILNACERDGLRPDEAIVEYSYTTKRMEPTESVQEAVSAVFDRGEVAMKDVPLWFYAPKYGNSEFHERQRFIAEIGGHRFFGEVM